MQPDRTNFNEAPFPGGGWSLYCAIISSFGFAGYYNSDLTNAWLPGWLAVGIMILPVTILVTVHWGELPDRVVMLAHGFAAALFFAMALGMEISHFLGYRPEGATFFRVLAHLGWTFVWIDVIRRVRFVRRQEILRVERAQEQTALTDPTSLPETGNRR